MAILDVHLFWDILVLEILLSMACDVRSVNLSLLMGLVFRL